MTDNPVVTTTPAEYPGPVTWAQVSISMTFDPPLTKEMFDQWKKDMLKMVHDRIGVLSEYN